MRTTDLYSLSKTNKYFSNVAEDILGQNLSKKLVIFKALLPYSSRQLSITETDEYIQVLYAKNAIKMIEKFGWSFRNLKIEHATNRQNLCQKQIKEVFELIQVHCAETLNQLHLERLTFDFFENVTKPFKNVQNVTLKGDMAGLGNDQLTFQQIFPSLQSLHLDDVRCHKMNILESELPHLEHLHVNVNKYDSTAIRTIINLIKKNPLIRSIVLINADENMLQLISNELSKLERLSIFNYEERTPNTLQCHFKNVKSFHIENCHDQSVPSGISFGEQLEDFESTAYPLDHEYTDFIVNNRNLKKIRIHGQIGLDNDDIQQLASANLNVIDMSICCEWDVEVENLVNLIKNSIQLNRLHLSMLFAQSSTMNSIVGALRDLLQNEWILNVDNSDIFIVRNSSEVRQRIQ